MTNKTIYFNIYLKMSIINLYFGKFIHYNKKIPFLEKKINFTMTHFIKKSIAK